jgi:hypothetical protein
VEALDGVLEDPLGVQVLEVGRELERGHIHKCTEPDRVSSHLA